jgi:uncharacterized sulfatase
MHGRAFLHPDGRPVPAPNTYAFAGRDRMGELEDRSRSARDARYRYIRHYHPDRPPMQHCDYPDQLHTWREMRRLASGESEQLAHGLPRSLLTPLQRGLVAPAKPAEELYDLDEDPYEECNLAAEPAHAATLARFRAALDEWLETYGDLGELAEDDLLTSWRPGGVWPVTATPQLENGTATCPTEGARIVWTADPPPATDPAGPDRLDAAVGSPAADGRHWYLLCAATPLPADIPVWVKACRLGFRDSAEIETRTRPRSHSLGNASI